MSSSQLSADTWLSANLGKPAFHLVGHVAGGIPDEIAGRLNQDRIFVDAKIATNDAAAIAVLNRHRFSLIETNVTLKCRRHDVPKCDFSKVCFATPDMADAVGAIAEQSFSFDRFHMDPLIPAETAGAIKREWARNYFSGNRGEWMVVAVDNAVPVGFLQLLRTAEDEVVIDLVAVLPGHRDRSLARSMVSFAARECPVSGAMIVGTQVSNTASIRLYELIGFSQHSGRYVFHHHGRDQC